ncbi:MAG: acetyl-CoA carboxylase, carboxyltransferase subunit beta, partial [Firmicutes bacterium]|nr:acetyl-CoA carboxylase, carboxyltransferase subunit beta [Bacillota bacterium]
AVVAQYHKCEDCGLRTPMEIFIGNLNECECGKSIPIAARTRLNNLVDVDSFVEFDTNVQSLDVLEFVDYNTKLIAAKKKSGELEAVITGKAQIGGYDCGLFVMEPAFFMGSMGIVVGEKITRLFEYCTKHKLPVVGFCASGGARMQEGIFSLMQMAKTSGAIKLHSDNSLLYISVLTNPTTGGVTASFASLGDIIIAEPKSIVAFAGPRVVEQTIRKKLPSGFQLSEFVLQKGFVDIIVKRVEMKYTLTKLLKLHTIPMDINM